jgi:hypothetical protein
MGRACVHITFTCVLDLSQTTFLGGASRVCKKPNMSDDARTCGTGRGSALDSREGSTKFEEQKVTALWREILLSRSHVVGALIGAEQL